MRLPYTSVAIGNLRPAAEWEMLDEDYDTLVWKDKVQSKPTKSEVEAEAIRLHDLWVNTEYQRKRAQEYPNFVDYLDGIVKGDQEQVQAYIDACLAVKEKYPKP